MFRNTVSVFEVCFYRIFFVSSLFKKR